MRSRIRALSCVVLIGLTVGTTTAGARGCQGAPGTSAVDQYCESIPSAGGTTSAGTYAKSSSVHKGKPAVSKATARALAAGGADGAAVLRLASTKSSAATPADQTAVIAGAAPPPARVTLAAAHVPSNDPFGAVASALHHGTVGSLYVWLFLATGGVGVVSLRRRRPN